MIVFFTVTRNKYHSESEVKHIFRRHGNESRKERKKQRMSQSFGLQVYEVHNVSAFTVNAVTMIPLMPQQRLTIGSC